MSAFTGHGIDDIENRDAAIRGLARRLVSNEHDLEDVVQETWLAAIEQPGGRVRNIDGWLRTVVRYTASRKRRRDAQRLHRELRVGEERLDEVNGAPDEPSPDALSTLKWAIQALREPYRGVIHLRYFEGLSIADICARLMRPPATVKSQLRRAMQQLRERMDREYGGERALWHSALVVALRLDLAGDAAPFVGPSAAAAPGAGSAGTGSSLLAWLGAGAAAAAVVVAAWLLPGGGEAEPPTQEVAQAPAPSRGAPTEPDRVERSTPTSTRVAAQTTVPLRGAPEERASEPTVVHTGPGLVKITGRAADKSPASELPVLIEPVSRHLLAQTEPLIELLDVAGTWSGELPAGEWRISPMRGKARTVDVNAARIDVDLTIPEGLLLGGLVVDPLGKPLSGTTIQGSWPGRRDVWLPLDMSDLNGVYEVVVDPQAWVYATDAGRSPSPIHSVRRSARGTSEPILLELGFVRPTIAGFVVDEAGNPIAGATVGTSVLPSLGIQLGRDGTWWTNRMPTRSTTDEQGRFGVDRVNPTTNQIVATAAGKTPWRGTLPAGSWPTKPLRITLEDANRLTGRVVDSSGSAVARAWIEVEQVWPFGPRRALTDEDGSFSLAELAPGDLTLRASAAEIGSVVLRRDIAAAESIDVTLELSDAATVRGRALGTEAEPLVGWTVALVPKRDLDEREALPVDEVWHDAPFTLTDESGGFLFLACDSEEHVALLFRPEAGRHEPSGLPQAWRRGIRPGVEALELTLHEETAGASLVGILDCNPSVSHSTKVLLRSVELNHAVVGELDRSCAFRFEDMPPGAYELFAWKPSRPPVQIAGLRLDPDTEVDLDRVRLPVDGALRIDVTTPGGASLRDMQVQLVSRYARFQGLMLQPTSSFDIQPDGTVYVSDLPPGEYNLRLETVQFADVYDRIVIEEGRETQRRYNLEPGRDFMLRVTSTVPLQPHERIDFSIIPEGGGAPIPIDGFQPTVPEGPFFLSFRFPEGSYRIAARTSTGLEAESAVLLAAGGPRRLSVDLSLGR